MQTGEGDRHHGDSCRRTPVLAGEGHWPHGLTGCGHGPRARGWQWDRQTPAGCPEAAALLVATPHRLGRLLQCLPDRGFSQKVGLKQWKNNSGTEHGDGEEGQYQALGTKSLGRLRTQATMALRPMTSITTAVIEAVSSVPMAINAYGDQPSPIWERML